MSLSDYDDTEHDGLQIAIMMLGIAMAFSATLLIGRHNRLAVMMIVVGFLLLVVPVELLLRDFFCHVFGKKALRSENK